MNPQPASDAATAPPPIPDAQASPPLDGPRDVTRLSDLTPVQWKSGVAAWLGWLFDGLDMHLYTLVATAYVAQLVHLDSKSAEVTRYSSFIQAAFLFGWAMGGGFFGRLGDLLGRSRALSLTILTYALFTGLSFFAQTWWHLLIFRFLAALGIGGEWAVGSSLLSETWPRRWRPWLAAILQTAVNIGTVGAGLATFLLAATPLESDWRNRCVFLVGVLPALLVLWIRRAVPEPPEWHAARAESNVAVPSVLDLFRGEIVRTTLLTTLVCALSLTAHWAFLFWFPQYLPNLPDVADWSDAEKQQLKSMGMNVLMISSIAGNFVAAFLSRLFGYRNAIAAMCLAYAAAVTATFWEPRSHVVLLWYCAPILGMCQGMFGLFTMYMPPLFPVLLRTTGAGFCYNIGRIAAAAGTIFFGAFSKVGDYSTAIFYAGFLFLPATLAAMFLPEPPDERSTVEPVE